MPRQAPWSIVIEILGLTVDAEDTDGVRSRWAVVGRAMPEPVV